MGQSTAQMKSWPVGLIKLDNAEFCGTRYERPSEADKNDLLVFDLTAE